MVTPWFASIAIHAIMTPSNTAPRPASRKVGVATVNKMAG